VHRHPLDGCFAKLERAWEHLDLLHRELGAYLERGPYRVLVQRKPDDAWYVATMFIEDSPVRLGVVLGDFVQNLRSALDHLVWQLVLAQGGKPQRSNTFPIYRAQEDFIRDVICGPKHRAALEGIDPQSDAWAYVEGLQPHHARDPRFHGLNLLRMFSDTDKHQLVQTVMSFPAPWAVRDILDWDPRAIPLETKTDYPAGSPLMDGAEIAELRFDPKGPDPQVYVKGTPALDIAFGKGFPAEEGDIALYVPSFDTMRIEVANIVQTAKRRFFS